MYKKWVCGKFTSENVRQKQVAKEKAKQCFLLGCAFSTSVQETADALLYVIVGWVSRSLKKIRVTETCTRDEVMFGGIEGLATQES